MLTLTKMQSDSLRDPLLQEAKQISSEHGYVTVSYLQRMMRIGYTRAARLVDLMVDDNFCEKNIEPNTGYRKIITHDNQN